ncbi:MAG: nicotinate-nucleotide adenylyltransferase [Lentisphaerae bacterium]|nr:nicotinate-nucleotide adenylyltransferase [Lentisphaerota bacterium]
MEILTRIGILGGTFNPVHYGHLILAQNAIESFDLAKVLMIPCSTPPHKNNQNMLPARHRIAMLELAIEGDFRLEISNVEIKRGGISYAIDTIRELHQIYRRAELCFIIGTDTLMELHLWKDIGELLKLCRFISFDRPGFEIGDVNPTSLKLDASNAEQLIGDMAKGCRVEISSSDIRHRIAEGMSIRYLVPRTVEMYIAEHSLYQAS